MIKIYCFGNLLVKDHYLHEGNMIKKPKITYIGSLTDDKRALGFDDALKEASVKHHPNFEKLLRNGLSIVLILTLISSGILLFNSFRGNQTSVYQSLDFRAFGLALLALLASWAIETVRIWLIANGLGETISLRKIFNINLATTFIGNITPFSSGGVPTQIYLLCQNGIQPGKSSAIVTLRVILTTLLFTLVAPVLFIFYRASFSVGLLRQVTTVAIPVSVLVSVLLITFIIKPKLAKPVLTFPLKFIKSERWLSKINPYLQKFLDEVEIFHQSVRQFRKGYNLILAILATLLYWVCFFAIAPCLISAFGLDGEGIFFKSVLIQFILIFIISYLPVPGGSGVMELGFFSMFAFIPAQIRAALILIWRLLSYHLATFVGGVILLKLIHRTERRPSEVTRG